VVRIMSIHKSKGLEFPVVLLGGLARKFNLRDLYEKVLIHSELGYGPQYIDTDLGLVHESAARTLIKQTLKRESLSEEERILYVALTRAREKLILLAAGSKLSAGINRAAIVPFKGTIPGVLALEAGSYLDWILMALLSHPDGTVLRDMSEVDVKVNSNAIGHFAVHLLSSGDLEFQVSKELEEEIDFEDDAELQHLLSRLEAQYPFESETALPAKITVTELKRKFADEEPEAMYLYPRPDFLKKQTSKLTAAEAGTALHTFLEHLDFNGALDMRGISEQMDALVMCHILSKIEAESIALDKVLRFVQSNVGKKLRTARKVCREVSFGFNIDAEPDQKYRELLKRQASLCNRMKADILNLPITALETVDAGTVGSAMLTGIAIGCFQDLQDAAAHMVKETVTYHPRPEMHERYKKIYERYKRLYKAVRPLV